MHVRAVVDERDEGALREVLATGEITGVERGHGGRSLAFRLTLEDGTRAYFKPEQTFSGTHWYAEIAAHHLDRALGLGRTPVVVGRRIAWSELEEAAGDDPRVGEIVVADDGTVRGAMVAWIEERLVPLRAPAGWERWIAIDPPPAITPFQSPRSWHAARATSPDPDELEARDEPVAAAAIAPSAQRDADDASVDTDPTDAAILAPLPDVLERPSELSDLVVFDYLVHNVDRWSANSTNVRTRGALGPLVFLDQAAGFSPRRARLTLMDERLAATQRFRRTTIRAVRRLDVEALARALDADPLSPILDAPQLAHLAERRDAILAHVDALVERHGEDRVYAW